MEFKVPPTGAEWRSAPRVCRCCLSEGCYKDISAEYYWMGEKETYADMLKECFDLTISFQEASNSNGRLICEVCITRLRDATNFKKQVIRSEQRFADHLQSGASLSTVSVTDGGGTFQEVKVEGVKDEMLLSDDDDDAPVDDDTLDPDYDESDSLPLKYEVQKKEALVELSFGDEIPTLSNTETTIRRVSSKSKEKSPSKKLKLNKKELTIKPVKASGSKVKAAKTPKVPKVPKAPKPAKPTSKKGRDGHLTENTLINLPLVDYDLTALRPLLDEDLPEKPIRNSTYQRSAKALARDAMKRNATTILEASTVTPFRWCRNCFMCSYCNEKFMETTEMKMHVKEFHKDDSVKDIYKKFKEISLINIDLTDSRCRLCDSPVDDIDELKKHLVSVHRTTFDDGQDGVLPFSLRPDSWQCVRCKEVFNNFLKLYEHMNMHYQNFICDTCGKGFMTAPRLRKHVESHTIGTYPCQSCERVFALRAAREHHRIRAHVKGPRYECPHCSIRFTNYYERMRHLSAEHDAKVVQYKCLHCDLTFATSGKRSLHVRTVHVPQEKKYGCPHCPWHFVTRYELKRHMVRHTGVRDFHCSVCGKSYPRVKTLREHMRAHNNDRRFVCAACGQAFLQKASWKQHLRAHHPERADQLMDAKTEVVPKS